MMFIYISRLPPVPGFQMHARFPLNARGSDRYRWSPKANTAVVVRW